MSTIGQSLEAQLAELTAQGCEQVFQEKISGKKRDRAQLERLLRPKLTQHQRLEAVARRNAGEGIVHIAKSYNVSHSTISRLA